MSILTAATELLATQWHLLLATGLVYVAVRLFNIVLQKRQLSKLPCTGQELGDDDKRRASYISSAKTLYYEGYRKFKNGVFRITTTRKSTVVVVDPRFLKELGELPDDVLSFGVAVNELMHAEYTKVRGDRPLLPQIVKKDITPSLNRLNPHLAEEVDLTLAEELPPCEDWTPVPINKLLLRIVAKVSGRIFVGPEVGRTEEYVDMAINYTVEAGIVQNILAHMKPWQRFLFGRSLPQSKTLEKRYKTSKDFLRPMIVARREAMKTPGYEKPYDVMQWVLDMGEAKLGKDDQLIETLTDIQLGLTFAAIHTTTLTATNAFYQIAAMPEFLVELREEIQEVMKEYGTFSTQALHKMMKLDSFLRESMRVEPLGWNSFMRKVLKPITLSNGQYIPNGCIIEVASHSVMNDPELVEDPKVFDPLRFYKKRRQEELSGAGKATAGATNQLVSVTTGNLMWGHGRHACPGRFFATNELKMIFGRALLNYDIKLEDGAEGRYPNIPFAETNHPDPSRKLLFKRISR